ncbi:MAG: HAD family hydrolase [Candidatus Izimaplasma sp.]|nr:HAD family hydrolase [Candidatus Izimaplasma bacterium]
MKKYLIALDLDGTLLYDWNTLKEETRKYLLNISKQGHKLVIATGRPFRSSERYYKMLELDTPIINYNGGLVTSKADDNFQCFSLTVEKEYILEIFENTKQYMKNAFGEIGDDIYLLHDTEEIRPLIHNFNGASLTVGDFKDTLPGSTNGFIIIANEGQGQYIEDYVEQNFKGKVLHRNWGNEYSFIIELFTPETNKGSAIEYVSKYLGFEKEQIIAFGDGHNDIEMLEYAGIGIAMSNAHHSLLEVADIILEDSNRENGIEKFLDKFLEIKK